MDLVVAATATDGVSLEQVDFLPLRLFSSLLSHTTFHARVNLWNEKKEKEKEERPNEGGRKEGRRCSERERSVDIGLWSESVRSFSGVK